MNIASKYAYELWSPNATLLADLTGHARNRTFTRTRNDAEDMSFDLDFNDFHRYCELINVHPRALLVPGQTELRIRRFNQYLVGGQIIYATPDISSSRQIITVRAAGFLNLFKDRFIPFTDFSAVDVASMCWQVINTSQSQTNGDFGVTLGSLPTIALSNQSPNRVRIKDFIQQLASSPAYGFDFEFTYAVRKALVTANGAGNSRGVVDAVDYTDLASWGLALELPQLVVDGHHVPFVGSDDVGHYLAVKLGGNRSADPVKGLRRVQK